MFCTLTQRRSPTASTAQVSAGWPNDDKEDLDMPIWAGVIPLTQVDQLPLTLIYLVYCLRGTRVGLHAGRPRPHSHCQDFGLSAERDSTLRTISSWCLCRWSGRRSLTSCVRRRAMPSLTTCPRTAGRLSCS